MPNWCSTTIEFSGDETAIIDFYKRLTEYTSKEFVKSDFGNWWLGNIVLGFGFTVDKPDSPSCRGYLVGTGIYLSEDNILRVTTETAWVPMLHMWRMIIDKHYSTEDSDNLINMTWVAEEFGCDLYYTNDISIWGCDSFYVDSCIGGKYYGVYYGTEHEAITDINAMLESNHMKLITSLADLEAYDFPEDDYITVHELEEVSDDYFE